MKVRCKYDELVPDKIVSRETVRVFLGEDEVLIEYRDLHILGKFKFYVTTGKGQSKYLVANTKNNRTVQIHQLIMMAPDGMEVDHINNNGLDNRRSNLRIVTHQQNQANLPDKKHSSKYRYVTWASARKQWRVYINVKGRAVNVGGFDDEREAAIGANNFIIKNKLAKRLNQV